MAQYKKDDVQNGILEAAKQLFVENGIENTRMADIAKLSRISVGNLYRYFPNKEALVKILCPENLAQDIKLHLVAMLQSVEHSPADDLFENAGWLLIKERFDQYLFDNLTAILIAASRDSYYHDFKRELSQALIALVVDQLKKCEHTSKEGPIVETALKLIYESLLDMTLEVFRGPESQEEKRILLKIINDYHLNGLVKLHL